MQEQTTLVIILRRIGPDDVPNDFGEDPCWSAFHKARQQPQEGSRLFLPAWLLARGLGFRSRNQAELISAGLSEVYPAALAGPIPDECWRLLNDRLPNSYFWGDWDFGRRLRVGAATAFVNRDLAPLAFGQLMQDDDLFMQLATEAESILWGRGFLRRVKRALKEIDSSRFAKRIALINRLI